MSGEQDWCLQCGAAARGSLSTPSWRSAATILAATAVLALGAAAAAYAALNKDTTTAAVTATVAKVTTPPAGVPTTPTTATPPATTATTPATTIPSTTAVKPPKIPLTASVPKIPTKAFTLPSSTGKGGSTTTTPSSTSTGGAGSSPGGTAPTPILLDTNAASTYNPYGYAASAFGDPSLAIDGDSSTGWTAAVEPAAAPKMAVGLLIDMKTKQRLSAAAVITSTPGMTVQMYGANGHTAPPSITDPAWVALSHSITVKKKHAHIKLHWPAGKTFTFIALWISSAPASSTPQAPGRVTVNELELFPAS